MSQIEEPLRTFKLLVRRTAISLAPFEVEAPDLDAAKEKATQEAEREEEIRGFNGVWDRQTPEIGYRVWEDTPTTVEPKQAGVPMCCPLCGGTTLKDLALPVIYEHGWDETREQCRLEGELPSWGCMTCGEAFLLGLSISDIEDYADTIRIPMKGKGERHEP